MSDGSKLPNEYHYPAGTVLFREGDEGKEMYVLRSGRVELTKKLRSMEKRLGIVLPGDFFGELSVICNIPRTATARVLEDASLMVIDPETLRFEIGTIDDLPPVGICGSGLIDLVAQLFLSGMIDLRGKYVPSRCGDRLEKTGGVTHLVLVPARDSGTRRPLTLSQPDIDALMRSKAAMYTILTTIAGAVNIPLNDLERFYVAGTFGSYINPRSAITIGMIPDLPLETYVPLGNSSLEGACRALLSRGDRREISGIRDRITYMELNVNQEFMNLFSAARFIPHTDRSLFPSVKEWRG